MKKKWIVTVVTAALALGALTGCGGKKDDGTITVAASATPHGAGEADSRRAGLYSGGNGF